MKKIAVILLALIAFVGTAMAQTKFMGIPVDGKKSQMIQKLKQKGFTYDASKDLLVGKFNGTESYVSIVEDNGRVWRVCVWDKDYTRSETSIRIRFNRLISQFENNKKYVTLGDNVPIDDKENISYECTVHDKRYEAVFYQAVDSVEMASIATQYFAEQEVNVDELSDEQKMSMVMEFTSYVMENYIIKQSVWFMLDHKYGSYGIMLFYDNENNRPNGEDL